MSVNDIQLTATRQTLMDEHVSIKVAGLQPNVKVTVIASTSVSVARGQAMFFSYAYYSSDDNGDMDVSTMPSVGGSYSGIEPMGLFWSMTLAPGQKPGLRFNVNDVTRPVIVKLTLCEGHVHDVVQCVTEFHHNKRETLQCCQIERWYMKWDGSILRIPVRSGNIRGTLFVPKDDGLYPGVIDMFGGAGGLMEFRAALLASHGFAVLALAYFAYDNLPQNLQLNLEYFNEAIDWLEAQPMVLKNSVGVIGVSLGANLACMTPLLNRKVKAVVSTNGTHYLCGAIFLYKGSIVPSYLPKISEITMSPGGAMLAPLLPITDSPKIDNCLLKIQQAARCTSFLFIYGASDNKTYTEHGLLLARRLNSSGHRLSRLLIYPGAGHLIEPPYTPLNRYVFAKIFGDVVDYGGDVQMHADAQESSWKEIITFLRHVLTTSCSRL